MNEEEINDALVKQMFPSWMTNFRRNMPTIWNSKCVSNLKEETHKPTAIIIGAGPSVFEHDHLKLLAENRPDMLIIACDKILISCLKAGLIPDIVTSIDSDPVIFDFFNHASVYNNCKKIKAVFATTIHPSVVRSWLGKMYFVNTHITGKLSDPVGVDSALQHISGKIAMNTSGNVGMFSFILAAYLGCKKICLVGMDLSGHHEFYSDYSKTWIAGLSKDLNIKVTNCTEGGTLYNVENMIEMTLKDFLKL